MKHRAVRTVSALVVVLGLVFASCDSRGKPHAVSAPRAFGHPGERLVVTPTDGKHVEIGQAAARRIFNNPMTTPSAVNVRVVFEGLATLHEEGIPDGTGSISGPARVQRSTVAMSSLEGRTVWIRVSAGEIGAHSCPAEPVSVPSGKVLVNPPRHIPFHFAVVVDAKTGNEADWSESLTTPICPTLRDR